MLDKFLMEPQNMHARESILMDKLSFDLKLAAAKNDYYLKSYYSTVDHDGFDLILDDDDVIKKLQVKTVSTSTTTSSWGIHKDIFRLTQDLVELLGYTATPDSVGLFGGVILQEFDASNNSLTIDYYYTDMLIITMYANNLLKSSTNNIDGIAQKHLSNVFTGSRKDKVYIPKSLFIRSNSPESLLSMIGLHGNGTVGWIEYAKSYVSHVNNSTDLYSIGGMSLPMLESELKLSYSKLT
ncbi:hypothetical protein [Aliivibrio fischeri]|uniref:hypothetical protein n=1 Tax=Aliivibrio fischeri TaxID=668 RepID=UPI0012D93D2D|nr:hypothetical protein [Aliivibrio fischeri]MUI54393.1 hypothetical protein [Aliivibrio fischeri]